MHQSDGGEKTPKRRNSTLVVYIIVVLAAYYVAPTWLPILFIMGLILLIRYLLKRTKTQRNEQTQTVHARVPMQQFSRPSSYRYPVQNPIPQASATVSKPVQKYYRPENTSYTSQHKFWLAGKDPWDLPPERDPWEL